MIELTCKYCHRTVMQHGGEVCDACYAKGIGLPQIKRVEKWQARDGSYHDSLEGAQKHQLQTELETALRACSGYPDRQAQHLLSHFDIRRKGEVPPNILTVPIPSRGHPRFYSFFWGCVSTALCGIVWLTFGP